MRFLFILLGFAVLYVILWLITTPITYLKLFFEPSEEQVQPDMPPSAG